MDVSGQLHAPTCFSPVTTGWDPEPIWTWWLFTGPNPKTTELSLPLKISSFKIIDFNTILPATPKS
jgi:hypothetical protein